MSVDLEAALVEAREIEDVYGTHAAQTIRDLVAECRRLKEHSDSWTKELVAIACDMERQRDEARRQLAVAREALKKIKAYQLGYVHDVAREALAKIGGES